MSVKHPNLLMCVAAGALLGVACSNSSSSSSSSSTGGVNRGDGGTTSTSSSTGGTSSSSSSSSSTGGGSSGGGTSSGSTTSSGPLPLQTIAGMKALIAAEVSCAQSTTACPYNTAPYHDYRLENVFVIGEQHADFDNKGRNDAGSSVAQQALYLADHAAAAPNEGIELIAPLYFTLPTLAAGDTVNVTGTLRANFGNTYFRVATIFKQNTGAPVAVTPVAVTAAQVGNVGIGVEGRDGGCNSALADNSQGGEPYEGALVDLTADLGAGVDIIFHPNTDGGVAHRFSLNNEVMVSDNYGALGLAQTDGGISLDGKKVTKLRGFSYYSFGCRKIQPRNGDDITFQ